MAVKRRCGGEGCAGGVTVWLTNHVKYGYVMILNLHVQAKKLCWRLQSLFHLTLFPKKIGIKKTLSTRQKGKYFNKKHMKCRFCGCSTSFYEVYWKIRKRRRRAELWRKLYEGRICTWFRSYCSWTYVIVRHKFLSVVFFTDFSHNVLCFFVHKHLSWS